MPENEILETVEELNEPAPTPEQVEEWERQRLADYEAKIAPFRKLREAIDQHDEAIIDAQFEIDMLKMEE